jgi:hypothetical protein
MTCMATAEDHCCWIGGVCDYFNPTPRADAEGHCTLRYEAGSWTEVYADVRYSEVRVKLDKVEVEVDCGDWPPSGVTCGTCGVTGDG